MTFKCYIIWENPAYKGTKGPGSNQTPRCVWLDPVLFVS